MIDVICISKHLKTTLKYILSFEDVCFLSYPFKHIMWVVKNKSVLHITCSISNKVNESIF